MRKDAENPFEENTRSSFHIPKALKTENRCKNEKKLSLRLDAWSPKPVDLAI